MNKVVYIVTAFLLIIVTGFAAAVLPGGKGAKHDYVVTIQTQFGDIKVILYDETPKHKENFLKLVNEGFYDSTTFHRVMDQFMIQGGDPNSKDDNPGNDGLGGPGYRIPAEFDSTLFHKKGALAAARQPDQVNPNKESSGSQFYIVEGRVTGENELNRMALYRGMKYSEEQKKAYAEIGGTPHLDGDYTVFGEVIEGLNIVDSITLVRKDRSNRPFENLYMIVTAEKLKKKKITKLYNYNYPEKTPQ